MTDLEVFKKLCEKENIIIIMEQVTGECNVLHKDSVCVNIQHGLKPPYWIQYHIRNADWKIEGLTEYIVVQRCYDEDIVSYIFAMDGNFVRSGAFGYDALVDVDYDATVDGKIVCKDCIVESYEVVGYEAMDVIVGNTEWRTIE